MQTSYNNDTPQFAGFFVRLAAFLIDTICVGALLLVMRFSLSSFLNLLGGNVATAPILFNYSILDVSLYVLKIVYFVLITYFTGTTIGKKLFKLRVINATGEPLSFFCVLYRETIGRFFSGFFCSLGYIMVGVDKEKRGIHDFLGDTRVVYAILPETPMPKQGQQEQVSAEAMMHQEQQVVAEAMMHQEQQVVAEAVMYQEQQVVAEAVMQQEQQTPTQEVTAEIESGYTNET